MSLYVRRFFGFTTPVPAEHRKNFIHLYLDIAFWGMVNGSVINFLGVYCSRIGATPFQMGLLTAIPALMNLLVTLPATALLRGKPSVRVVPIAALITRTFYLALVPLPILLPHDTQLWVILGIVLLQNITGAIAATMGNVFLAETIPPAWRGQVVGTRSALVAMTTMLTSLVIGQILSSFSLGTGYLLLFAIGYVGSMASSYQLFKIKPVNEPRPLAASSVAPSGIIRLSILRGPFSRVLILMFVMNVAIFLPQAIFPLYQVKVLHLTDRIISLAASLFSVVQFFSSAQAGSISHRWGFKRMSGIGMVIASVSTLMFTLSYTPWIYFATQLVGGFGWALFNNGTVNYLLEKVPEDDRPPHLAWFNLAANAAVLICGLLSAQIVSGLGLFGGMMLAIGMRMVAGVLMLKYG